MFMITPQDQLQKVFAENLRQRRKLLRLSQEALALLAGVDRTFVSQIERGIGNPSLQTMARLANTLDIDLPSRLIRADDGPVLEGP